MSVQGREINTPRANDGSPCYSYDFYSNEDRSIRHRHLDARPGGAQPVERRLSGVPAALPSYARHGARDSSDELPVPGGTDRDFEAIGTVGAGTPDGAAFHPAADGASDSGSGVHDPDALGAPRADGRL